MNFYSLLKYKQKIENIINKKLNGKQSQKRLDNAKQSAIDAL